MDSSPPPIPPPIPGGGRHPSLPPKRLGDDAGLRLLLPVGRSGWAIAAGYAGLFALLILPAPIALILGILGWRDIRRSQETAEPKHGMGRVVFALITGVLGTGLLVLFIVLSQLR